MLAVGRKHWLVVTALVIGLIIGATSGGADSSASIRSELDRLRSSTASEIAELRGQSSRLRAENARFQGQAADLATQLRSAKAKQPLPGFVGRLADEAEVMASELGWSITVEERESAKPAGTVLSQNPRPGTVMGLGAPLTIVIAKALPPKVPSLVGKTLQQAKAAAEKHGWKLVVRRETSSQAPGTVIRQTPQPGVFIRGAGTLMVIVAKKAPVESGGGNCHPSYKGECLAPDASDYDCAGGSGNGPYYVYGTVQVVGPDVFGLDADNDGWGCE
jgi:hypothetical protein